MVTTKNMRPDLYQAGLMAQYEHLPIPFAYQKKGENYEYQKPYTVAVCTSCGAPAHSAQVINQRCGRNYDGKRCQGIYRSALALGDWRECPICNATGRDNKKRCTKCEGEGWIYSRK
jgi:DnaJ-class molecular chaperone